MKDRRPQCPSTSSGTSRGHRQRRPPPARRGLRTLAVVGLLPAVLTGLVAGVGLVLSEGLGANLVQVPAVFTPLDTGVRPAAGAELNVLLVGTDTRSSAPTTGTDAVLGREGEQSVVYLDRARGTELWNALRTSTTAGYAARHPEVSLGEMPP